MSAVAPPPLGDEALAPQRVGARMRTVERLRNASLLAVLLALPAYYTLHDLATTGSLDRIGNNLVDGLSNGAIWALIALGYTLVYGIIELINFAHGDVSMIGAFTAVGFFGTLGLSAATGAAGLVFGILATLVVTALATGVLGVLIERVAYRPLRNAPRFAPVLTAVGMSFILQNVGLLWLGPTPVSVPDLIGSNTVLLDLGGVEVSRGDVLALLLPIPLLLALSWFIARTRMGRAMRASAQNPEAARLMGINVDSTITTTFLVGGALAGAGGLIYALYQTTVWYFQGFTTGLIAFTAAIVGGIGSLKGAVVGGLLIGVIQALSDNRIGSDWTVVVVFAYLIAVIVLKPDGLYGERGRNAG
jgi:branched-chain amino acid transport system permease protein